MQGAIPGKNLNEQNEQELGNAISFLA